MTNKKYEANEPSALPKSLARFDLHQERYYQKLQSQPMFKMISPVIEDYIRKIVDKGAFCMRVSPKVLEDILKDGNTVYGTTMTLPCQVSSDTA